MASEEIHRRFAEFVRIFEDSEYDECSLEGNQTEVTRAYHAFLECMAAEVRDVPQGDLIDFPTFLCIMFSLYSE